MSVQVENLEKNMAKLTIEVPEDEVEKALNSAYLKQKGKISVPGFRKGKVPKAMVERMYGPSVFYEEAANQMLQTFYPTAADESGLEIVSRPTIDIAQIEKGKPFIFTAEVAVRPEVTLGQYQGVKVKKMDTSVPEEEVDTELEKERAKSARTITVEDRPVAAGDMAVIDYEGFVDGVPFEGGKAENHSLEIGSHSFIDTFEEQLIGRSAGEECEINVTFPEDYQTKELAGKPALFQVKIREIKKKELPELNDEFAQDVSDFSTLEEYRADIRKKLVEDKEKDVKGKQEDEAIQKIINGSKMEIPEPMIDMQCENIIREFSQRLSMSGLTVEQYMQFSGATADSLKEQVRPEAVSRIQSRLVLEQIAKDEQFEITEDDLNTEIEKMAKTYNTEVDKLKENMGDEGKKTMKKELEIQKALKFITDHMVETEAEDEDEPEVPVETETATTEQAAATEAKAVEATEAAEANDTAETTATEETTVTAEAADTKEEE